jgi:hypothetical protein
MSVFSGTIKTITGFADLLHTAQVQLMENISLVMLSDQKHNSIWGS